MESVAVLPIKASNECELAPNNWHLHVFWEQELPHNVNESLHSREWTTFLHVNPHAERLSKWAAGSSSRGLARVAYYLSEQKQICRAWQRQRCRERGHRMRTSRRRVAPRPVGRSSLWGAYSVYARPTLGPLCLRSAYARPTLDLLGPSHVQLSSLWLIHSLISLWYKRVLGTQRKYLNNNLRCMVLCTPASTGASLWWRYLL